MTNFFTHLLAFCATFSLVFWLILATTTWTHKIIFVFLIFFRMTNILRCFFSQPLERRSQRYYAKYTKFNLCCYWSNSHIFQCVRQVTNKRSSRQFHAVRICKRKWKSRVVFSLLTSHKNMSFSVTLIFRFVASNKWTETHIVIPLWSFSRTLLAAKLIVAQCTDST